MVSRLVDSSHFFSFNLVHTTSPHKGCFTSMTAGNPRCQRRWWIQKRVIYTNNGSSFHLFIFSHPTHAAANVSFVQCWIPTIILHEINLFNWTAIVGLRYQPKNGNLHIVSPDFCFSFFCFSLLKELINPNDTLFPQ